MKKADDTGFAVSGEDAEQDEEGFAISGEDAESVEGAPEAAEK